MRDRPTENPTNRFRAVAVEYEPGEAPPPSSITLIEDQSRTILSRNDSPDLDFRWSCNPYRGCLHACVYCASGDTQIMMADSRTRELRALRVGDEIIGTTFDGKYRRYVRTQVLDVWQTHQLAYRVTLDDGTELVTSGDHRFLSNRGWKYVQDAPDHQRPHLTFNNHLLGPGRFAMAPEINESYRRGYLAGMIRGDGTIGSYRTRRGGQIHHFRLALVDLEALHRSKAYLTGFGVETREFVFSEAHDNYKAVRAISASSRRAVERVRELITKPETLDLDWQKGWLAGIFDAEGSHDHHILRIANGHGEWIETTLAACHRLAFDAIVEAYDRGDKRMYYVRVRGGLGEHLRFFHTTAPAITRKWDITGAAVKSSRKRLVAKIVKLDVRTLYDITTGTGDFIANGVISHNCYARPTHEYLDLGAGTDFDTKIVVKREAPELLREAFDKPSWQGELVMFSGVTDCYQPVEKDLELTRRCLEVCLEYRNPVAVISKSALVTRDTELLAELAREAGACVSVSLAWVDDELARTIEPWAASPTKRFKVIETLAKAGVPVGVMCAPIIPGLNDDQLVRVLERARDAGAMHAGWTLLRLPGAVAGVFEERVRAALPLSVDKIMNRVRDTRGGGEKVYDSRFGVRGRGEGAYASAIDAMFDATVARLGFDARDRWGVSNRSRFKRPQRGQLSLF